MNETIRSILTRRSTREGLSGDPVDRGILELIVRAGLAAPSSKNAQPWRFHVVEDRDLLDWVADRVVSADGIESYVPHDPLTGLPYPDWGSTVEESADVLRVASAAVFVLNSGRFSRGRDVLGSVPRPALRSAIVGYGLEMMGVGSAIQNMLIAAHSLQLGCAFMGDVVIAEEAIRERFHLEGDLVGVVVLGPISDDSSRLPPRTVDETGFVTWHSG